VQRALVLALVESQVQLMNLDDRVRETLTPQEELREENIIEDIESLISLLL